MSQTTQAARRADPGAEERHGVAAARPASGVPRRGSAWWATPPTRPRSARVTGTR
jgi:hypothetical protein